MHIRKFLAVAALALPDSAGSGHSSPGGYAVRALDGESELPAWSWLSWKAFHPDEKYAGRARQ